MSTVTLSYFGAEPKKVVSPAEDLRIGRAIICIYWLPILVPMILLTLSVQNSNQSFIHDAWVPTYFSDCAAAGPFVVPLSVFPPWRPGEPLRLCPELVPPIAGVFLTGALAILMLASSMRYRRRRFHICVSILWWLFGIALPILFAPLTL